MYKYLLELIKRRSKAQEKYMSRENYFPKSISQQEFDYGLFTNLPRIIVACDFSRVHSNSEKVSYFA